ncbi:MAG TPA: rhodanese-like domain-containing protein [Terriglobales bacterium]|nr:rhodanese-like domain-containing protein [Terriglobales bacterium]
MSRSLARRMLVPVLAGALLLGAAQPAAPPDHPVKFISVDELKAMMDRGAKVDVIDVRGKEEYDETHIKGARSIPIRTIEQRAARELPKKTLVVFY